jgi:hypothetical protein
VEIKGTIDQSVFPVVEKIGNDFIVSYKPVSASIINSNVISVLILDKNFREI